jgi:hypothetical protein
MEYFSIFKPSGEPEKDAWLANIYTENHLAYEALPDQVAPPEQLRFIVYLDDEDLYYPCPDRIFEMIVERNHSSGLLVQEYMKIFNRLEPVVKDTLDDSYKRTFLLDLLRIKFRHETASMVMFPSRLEKRLLQIFTRISEIERPMARQKEAQNRRMRDIINSGPFMEALNSRDGLDCEPSISLENLEFEIKLLKLGRLLSLACHHELWTGSTKYSADDFRGFMRDIPDDEGFRKFRNLLSSWNREHGWRYILWMGSMSGSVMIDLAMINILVYMGIKVIMSVKQAFYYDAVTISDVMYDPYLNEALAEAEIINNPRITKNELLDKLQSDRMLFIISDGTQERFNPLLSSVTFARVFKECDLAVSRCPNDVPCFQGSHFRYTRDVVSLAAGENGIATFFKEHHPAVTRFSVADLKAKADALIQHLKAKKDAGATIMFYSAIVGSIPHQLETAKEVLNTFVNYLRERQEGVVIINPGEHFEPGMDADDMMYMWEIVQRSGIIDIWRFQTVDDIETAFELMGRKVPPEWVGKDATYSTGCTKEMKIALEVQEKRPEMQIIGPAWEKFLRRKEYGVGKLYDRSLEDV